MINRQKPFKHLSAISFAVLSLAFNLTATAQQKNRISFSLWETILAGCSPVVITAD
jgi:hypothetical protein